MADSNAPNLVSLPDPTVPTELSDQDKMNLELAKAQLRLAQANAEKESMRFEATQWAHKYALLQLYIKYGLSVETDGIDEQGKIVRNVQPAQS